MSYLDAYLVPGETVAYRTWPHWVVAAPALILGSLLDLTGVGLVAAAFFRREPDAGLSTPMIVAGAILMLIASVWMAVEIVRWKATQITVTTRRVLIKTGVLARRTREVLLAKIESVSVEEPVIGRVLGFGKVVVYGTGGTPETFERIARPQEFRRRIQIQIEALSGAGKTARG